MQPAAMGVAMAGAAGSSKAMDTIVVAPGVPALKRSLVDSILAGKFTDLGELPPARGFGKTPAALSSDVEGKIVLVYDQYFRQEAADTGKTDWSKIDSSIHTQCFTGMSLSAEGWCSICTSMDHTKHMCPYRSQDEHLGPKRPLAKPGPPSKKPRPHFHSEEACSKWNKYHYLSCPHGESCAYTHECSICRATDHGALKCPKAKSPPKPRQQ